MTLINHVGELEPTPPALPLTHFTSPALGSVLSHTRTRTHRQRERGRERERGCCLSFIPGKAAHSSSSFLCLSPDFSSHAGILTLLLLAPPARLPVSVAADDINRASLPSSLHTVYGAESAHHDGAQRSAEERVLLQICSTRSLQTV